MSKATELRQKVLQKEFSKMNPQQQEAVFQVNGPLLILAGAGSGKTTVLINRIANLIRYGNAYHDQETAFLTEKDLSAMNIYLNQSGTLNETTRSHLAVNPCSPYQILAITFTNKAAGEIKDRLERMLGEEGRDIWASTFHTTCSRILRKHSDRLGYTNHFVIYDSDDSRRLIKECQKSLNIDDKTLSYKTILNEISHAKDQMISPKAFMEASGSDFRLGLIAKAYQLYQTRLHQANAMDFDDLLCNTVQLFIQCPDVLEYYQNRFRYIMVDEYQDTNHVQYLFIKLLAQKYQNICVVGDDDQSIYKFRGATIENILSFEKSFPGAKTIRLEQNYRSTKNILAAANAVIENNVERKGKTLWTENPQGEKISLHTSFSETDEADYISKQILEGVAAGRKFSDYAILYRMNSQSNILEKVFVKSSIPYRIIGGIRFYERKEIKDLIAYFSVIVNPLDEIRLLRIINQPKRAIGNKTIAQALEISVSIGKPLFYVISHADEFEDLKKSASKLMDFARLINQLIALSSTSHLNEFYQTILEKTQYIEKLKESGDEDVQDRIDNLHELSSSLIHFEENYGEDASLEGFLEEVSLMTDIDNYDDSTDAVVMMTMHSAKGLEFPCVFLPGFEEGIFPGIQTIYNPGETEEERRLAYVAITRAREKLTILNAERRMIFGTTNRNKPSRFSQEIPEDLVVKSRTSEWKKPAPGTVLPVSAYEKRSAATNSSRRFGPAAIAQPSKTNIHYQVGDTVNHKTFGTGMIISATPMGNDTLLEIAFNGVGTKKIMANFARLTKI